METFTIKGVISAGWNRFKERPWLFVGAMLLTFIIYAVLDILLASFEDNKDVVMIVLMNIVSFVVGTFVGLGLIAFALKAEKGVETLSLKDLWAPEHFWRYLGVTVLVAVITVLGFILFIIPGIVAMVTLLFASYIVVDRGMGPWEAIKESGRITEGHRWKLLGFVLVLVGLNILGAVALGVGLLVTIPVTMLSMVYTYRILGEGAAKTGESTL